MFKLYLLTVYVLCFCIFVHEKQNLKGTTKNKLDFDSFARNLQIAFYFLKKKRNNVNLFSFRSKSLSFFPFCFFVFSSQYFASSQSLLQFFHYFYRFILTLSTLSLSSVHLFCNLRFIFFFYFFCLYQKIFGLNDALFDLNLILVILFLLKWFLF